MLIVFPHRCLTVYLFFRNSVTKKRGGMGCCNLFDFDFACGFLLLVLENVTEVVQVVYALFKKNI